LTHLVHGFMKSGDEIELSVELPTEVMKGGIEVKKCGIHLLVNEPGVTDTSGDQMTQFFVGNEFRIYGGDTKVIMPLDEANATQVDESDFYSSILQMVMMRSHPSANE
jgi:hypothetical protein